MSECEGRRHRTKAHCGARDSRPGPSPELAALSRSTHFDWELALYDIAGSHAHAKALAAAGLSHGRRGDARCTRGSTASPAASPTARCGPVRTTKTCTARSSRRSSRDVGPELGGKLRAGRSRNDQIATLVRMYLLDHSRTIARDILRAHRRDRGAGRGAPRGDHARTHAPAARAAGAARPSPAGARAGRSCATSSGSATGRCAHRSRRTAGERSPARRSGSTRSSSRANSASRGRPRTRSTARRRATSSPSSRSSRR